MGTFKKLPIFHEMIASWSIHSTTIVILKYTGAQEWHIVSLLVDVTSPTTVAHYVSMTSDNREALTAAPTAHSVQKQAFRVNHWASREASLRHSSGWGTEAFPLSSVICAPMLKYHGDSVSWMCYYMVFSEIVTITFRCAWLPALSN